MVCQVCQSAPDHRVDPVDRVQLPSNAVVADNTAVGSRVDDTVTGRAWCAYACPVGLTLDLLTALFRKLKVRQMKRSEKFNRWIRHFKYFFFVFYFVLHFWIGFDPGWILVFLLVVTSPFIVRFWCSFCPCGLFFGWLNRISPLKLEKNAGKCRSCGLCSRQCPMQAKRISIQKTDGAVYSTECMMCGECIGKCPAAGAARLTLFGKTLTESKPGRKSPNPLNISYMM